MASINLDRLWEPVSVALPAGGDLGDDPDYSQLGLSVETTQQRGADAWRPLRETALALAARTKDLRVYVWLARALTNTEGMVGLASALDLVRDGVERYWDELHPRLDPDDGFDPGQRVAYLEELADRGGLVGDIRAAPLVGARGVGVFSLYDMRLASGAESASDGRVAPDPNLVDAAFKGANAEELEATRRAVLAAVEQARALDRAVAARLKDDQPRPQLERLHGALAMVVEEFGQRVAMPAAPASEARATGGNGAAGPPSPAGAGAAAAPSAAPADGRVNSRDDVIRTIDRVLEYYARAEPSSPVPLLLNRAKRLVKMDFLQAIEDLVPGGLSEVQKLGGLKVEGKPEAKKPT